MRKQIFVCDIGLASILDAFGIPKRECDPLTREIRTKDGKETETAKWWYDISADGNELIVTARGN